MEIIPTNNNKFRRISEYIFIAIIFIIVLSIRECTHQNHITKLVGDVYKYSDSAKYYKDKHKNVVAYNKVLELKNKKMLDDYLSSNKVLKDVVKSYKSINVVTEIKTKTLIHDTVLIPFEKPIPCYFKPFRIVRDEPNSYRFVGIMSNSGFGLDTMLVYNSQSVVVGNKKVGFLRHETRVEVINSNPIITTTNVGSFVVNPDKKWYNKPLVTFGIGVVAGFGFNSIISYSIPNR